MKPKNTIEQKSSFRINAAFATLLLGVTAYLIWWGLGYTNHNHTILFITATLFGVFMAFNIGGNDVANSFGTSVGAGTLTIPQALGVAAVFEVSGALIAGGEVTDTIRKGIVDLSAIHLADGSIAAIEPLQFILLMMSALVAAAFWLLFATKKGWPVSTTHSIIGGLVGASITLGIMLAGSEAAFETVKWDKIGQIALSWVLSPVLGGIAAFILYAQIKKYILGFSSEELDSETRRLLEEQIAHEMEGATNIEKFEEVQKLAYTVVEERKNKKTKKDKSTQAGDTQDDLKEKHKKEQKKLEAQAFYALQNYVPILAAVGGMVISAMLLFKGLKNLHLELTIVNKFMIMIMVATAVWATAFVYAKTLKKKNLNKATFALFSWMQVFTAAGFAFSHGSNDIANAIGPFAAIMDTMRTGMIGTQAAVPPIAMLTFGVALVVGLWFIGKEVIQTVGHNLTKMHPASGFSAELAAAAVVMIASTLGMPVSSTHILVGAVLGIGLVNKNANWKLMRPIAMAWVITLPAAGIIASLAFIGFSQIF